MVNESEKEAEKDNCQAEDAARKEKKDDNTSHSQSEEIEVVQPSEVLFTEQQAIVQSLRKELEESKNKISGLQESMRRLAADFDNYKKWVVKERQTVERTATESLIRKLIDIYESLEKAINTEIASSESSEFTNGIKMIYKEFDRILKSEGLEPIEAVGSPLDVYKHEVLMQMTNDDVPENTVLEEVQRGYLLNSFVLRPAKVVVSQKAKQEEQGQEEKDKVDIQNQEDIKGE